jgi:iron complex transport system permease protein
MVAVFLASLCVGQYPLSMGEVADALMGGDNGETANNVVWRLRMPRLIAACLVGVALSVAGMVYQATFRNELASPDIIGVSSGASVGIALGLLAGMPLLWISVSGFFAGVSAMALTLALARLFRNKSMTILIISGVLVSGLMGSAVSMIKSVANADTVLPNIVFWLMGSFSNVSAAHVFALVATVPLCVAFLLLISGKILNSLMLGPEHARSKGVNYRRWRAIVLAFATVLTALSVAVAGVVGWAGLVVPHVARLVAGHSAQRSMPLAIAFGGAFMMACDTLSRSLTASEIPVGAITGFLGIILFISILAFKRGQRYGDN